jgi:hypothetical protein
LVFCTGLRAQFTGHLPLNGIGRTQALRFGSQPREVFD